MKRQLDRLKGKRLVTGDPNLMTKDEICINATPNGVEVKEIGTDGKIKDLAGSGDNGGGEGGVKEYYYRLNFEYQGDDLNEDVLATIQNLIKNSLVFIGLTGKIDGTFIEVDNIFKYTSYFAFRIPNIKQPYVLGEEGNATYYPSEVIVYENGNLYDRITYLLTYDGIHIEEINELVNIVKKVIIEITKEEYESMIGKTLEDLVG